MLMFSSELICNDCSWSLPLYTSIYNNLDLTLLLIVCRNVRFTPCMRSFMRPIVVSLSATCNFLQG